MPIEIVPYRADHVPLVRAFNSRLRVAAVPFAFPETHVPRWLPPTPGSNLFQEYFLAVAGDFVRGGYILKHQDFLLRGEVTSIGFLEHPLSEGIADKRYSLVGLQLLRHALKRQPLLYALGIGGNEEPVARLLRSARFEIVTVPFYFRVEHAAPFLREVRVLRSSRIRRILCDIGAATGLGSVGIDMLQRYQGRRSGGTARVVARAIRSFDISADEVWAASRANFMLVAVRDRPVLAKLYDTPRNPFLRVSIEDAGEARGWAVCLATPTRNHKYFGDLKLGSIVDCLVLPGYERAIVDAAVERLRREEVDLIVTNQLFQPLGEALRGAGFLPGPSNFLFATSPQLNKVLDPLGSRVGRMHVTRGDGDGPINL